MSMAAKRSSGILTTSPAPTGRSLSIPFSNPLDRFRLFGGELFEQLADGPPRLLGKRRDELPVGLRLFLRSEEPEVQELRPAFRAPHHLRRRQPQLAQVVAEGVGLRGVN